MFRSAIFAACVAAASAFAPLSSPLPNAVSGESKPPGVCCGSVAGTCQRVPGEIPMRSWWRSRHNSTLSGSTAQWRSQPSDHPRQPMAKLAEVMCLDSSEHGSDPTLCTSFVSGRFAVLSDPVPVAGRVTATSGPSMQLFGEGKVQGKGVVAIPPLGRPDTPMFDGWSAPAQPPLALRCHAETDGVLQAPGPATLVLTPLPSPAGSPTTGCARPSSSIAAWRCSPHSAASFRT